MAVPIETTGMLSPSTQNTLLYETVFVKQNAKRPYRRYLDCTVWRELVKIWTTEIVSKSAKLYFLRHYNSSFINDIKSKAFFFPVRQVYHVLDLSYHFEACCYGEHHIPSICHLHGHTLPTRSVPPHWTDSEPGSLPELSAQGRWQLVRGLSRSGRLIAETPSCATTTNSGSTTSKQQAARPVFL